MVKTRLAAAIGHDRAALVYEAMLRDLFRSIGDADERTMIEVMWAPTAAANESSLRRAFGERPMGMQTGDTLGDRLAMAMSERFFFHRTQKIVVIGVDDPTLPRELIDHAFALLDSCEWVIGPASDGGYYMVGCRAQSFDSGVFAGIEWGTSTVCAATLQRIRELEASVAVMPVRSDIDVVGDLDKFRSREQDGEVVSLVREWQL